MNEIVDINWEIELLESNIKQAKEDYKKQKKLNKLIKKNNKIQEKLAKVYEETEDAYGLRTALDEQFELLPYDEEFEEDYTELY